VITSSLSYTYKYTYTPTHSLSRLVARGRHIEISNFAKVFEFSSLDPHIKMQSVTLKLNVELTIQCTGHVNKSSLLNHVIFYTIFVVKHRHMWQFNRCNEIVQIYSITILLWLRRNVTNYMRTYGKRRSFQFFRSLTILFFQILLPSRFNVMLY
jgi:hypothetical protein